MINISNLTAKEVESELLDGLDLFADSEGYLQDLSEQEEVNILGGASSVQPTYAASTYVDPI